MTTINQGGNGFNRGKTGFKGPMYSIHKDVLVQKGIENARVNNFFFIHL